LKAKERGFTLVEIMVAMVVLAIGLLGMAAMTILVMKGGRGANDMTAATNICQLKMEELKNISWTSLGNAADRNDTTYTTVGLNQGWMAMETDLNSQGKTRDTVIAEGNTSDQADALGPYKYRRTFVICRGDKYDGIAPNGTPQPDSVPYTTPAAGQRPQEPDCNIDQTDHDSRTEPLACKSNDIMNPGSESKEKKIKILCSWRDRGGDCHSVKMDTTVVQLNN
jgi:prepilin-type N-terminal cleavage/methylation domain-containing protein